MKLFNLGLVLIVVFVLSLLIGAVLSSDKNENFGATLRRGFITLLLLGLFILVGVAFNSDPTLLQQVMDFFTGLFQI